MEYSGALNKVLICAGLMLITLVVGVILTRSGKPYNTAVFTIHKLAAVAFAVIAVILFVNFNKAFGMDMTDWILAVLMGVSLIGVMVSGGLISTDQYEVIMKIIHKISTALLLFSGTLEFYRILKQISESAS